MTPVAIRTKQITPTAAKKAMTKGLLKNARISPTRAVKSIKQEAIDTQTPSTDSIDAAHVVKTLIVANARFTSNLKTFNYYYPKYSLSIDATKK
jgi:hypothetical protein